MKNLRMIMIKVLFGKKTPANLLESVEKKLGYTNVEIYLDNFLESRIHTKFQEFESLFSLRKLLLLAIHVEKDWFGYFLIRTKYSHFLNRTSCESQRSSWSRSSLQHHYGGNFCPLVEFRPSVDGDLFWVVLVAIGLAK